MDEYEDDEQAAQKRNGRTEALVMQNEELKEQVSELTRANYLLKEKLNTALVTGTTGACTDLKQEFLNILSVHKGILGMSVDTSVDDFTDSMGIMALTNIHKALQKSNSASHGRQSTTSSRTGTAVKMDVEEMQQRIIALEDELHTALLCAEDIRLLKAKLSSLVERARIDKERLIKSESESAFAKKKMEMLRDHLEKLMTHLKHEAAAKVRSQEQLRVKERDLYKVEEQARIIQRKSSAKDRLVLELREGSKILEDQLRLMDEKYLELRLKLDWARENGEKKVKKAQAAAKALRIKFTMLSGGSTSLDKIQLPSLSQSQSYLDMGSMVEGSMDYGGSQELYSAPGTGTGKSKGILKGSKLNAGRSIDTIGTMNSAKQPTLDGVLEKIRKHAGGKTEWTDDQLRELTKSR